MRKILFIICALILSASAFPQEDEGKITIRLSGSSAAYADTIKVRQISSRTVSDSIANMKAGVFNVLDYGAVSGDGLSDVSGINAAIAAATDFSTVVIPPGNYEINDTLNLKSNIHIDIAEDARLWIASGYSGSIWYSGPGSNLVYCYLTGGYYIEHGAEGNGWDWLVLDKQAAADYVMFCHFRKSVIRFPNIAIKMNVRNGGWINGNTFSDLVFDRFVSGIRTRRDDSHSGNEITGNLFSNIHFQCNTQTKIAIDSFAFNKNRLLAIYMWDFVVSPTAITYNFTNASQQNDVELYVDDQNSKDNGKWNKIYQGYKTKIPNIDVYSPDSTNAVFVSGGVIGTEATPAGDVGFRIKSYRGSTPASANGSARVLSRNEATNNSGSWLILQTHGTASNATTYLEAMKISPIGGVGFPFVSTGTITTGMTRDDLGRTIYYNEAAATDLTADPQIIDGFDGQIITIIGGSDSNTLTLDDGTGLALSGQCVLGVGDAITLVYNATLDLWVEVSRSNN